MSDKLQYFFCYRQKEKIENIWFYFLLNSFGLLWWYPDPNEYFEWIRIREKKSKWIRVRKAALKKEFPSKFKEIFSS